MMMYILSPMNSKRHGTATVKGSDAYLDQACQLLSDAPFLLSQNMYCVHWMGSPVSHGWNELRMRLLLSFQCVLIGRTPSWWFNFNSATANTSAMTQRDFPVWKGVWLKVGGGCYRNIMGESRRYLDLGYWSTGWFPPNILLSRMSGFTNNRTSGIVSMIKQYVLKEYVLLTSKQVACTHYWN